MSSSTEGFTNDELKEYINLLESELAESKTQIERLNTDLLKAKGKIMSQDITLASYKDKVGIPLIVEGKEKDLYKSEQKDLIIEIIESYMSTLNKFSRNYKICESILNANSKTGTKDNMKEGLYQIFKNYTGMTKDILSSLSKLGFSVDNDGTGHWRIKLADDERYTISVSRTPSDQRSGLNALSDMNKLFF